MTKMIGKRFRQWKRKKNNAGFTLPEVLISVGILAILAAIGMVAVASYQKSLKLTEMDATAREIFVAAQNHLSAAKASGEWERYKEKYDYLSDTPEAFWGERVENEPSDWNEEKYGTFVDGKVTKGDGTGEALHVINRVVAIAGEKGALDNTVYDVILPEFAIDPTVADDGTYIIEYDIVTGTIYGVFYTDRKDSEIVGHVYGSKGLNSISGRENANERKSFKPIIGYYGGASSEELTAKPLEDIEVNVLNEECLVLDIKDPNYGKVFTDKDGKPANTNTRIVVTFTGEESKETSTWSLDVGEGQLSEISKDDSSINKTTADWWEYWTVKEITEETPEGEKSLANYKLYLDDITTKGGHFAELFKKFIPGENIQIKVSCTSTNTLSTTKYGYGRTNSLFASRSNPEAAPAPAPSEVSVANIRHLQNLSPVVSNLPIVPPEGKGYYVAKVKQTKSLDWAEEVGGWKWDEKSIFAFEGKNPLVSEVFYGIVNTAISEYDGGNHAIGNLPISCKTVFDGHAYGGLFSAITGTQFLTVNNLILENFKVSGESEDDATAGTLVGATLDEAALNITNVTVINPTVVAKGSGNAGGIVGSASGGKEVDSSLSSCAVYLKDDPDSMGAAARNADEKYKTGSYNSKTSKMNGKSCHVVAESGSAGGLTGKIESSPSNEKVTVRESFASVPVITETGNAGGLIGEVESPGTMITNSYSGGFTESGTYSEESYNVAQTGNSGENAVGGLVGLINAKTTVQNSYSTCSVYGFRAGGFVGVDKKESKYLNCYSTGKVAKNKENDAKSGAFAESLAVSANVADQPESCYYLAGVNSGLGTVSEGTNVDGIVSKSSVDLGVAVFKECIENGKDISPKNVDTPNHGAQTHNYDEKLDTSAYPFATVNKTASNDETANIVEPKPSTVTGVHYGDWPEVSFQAELAYYEIYLKGTEYTLGLYNRALGINSLIDNPDDPNNQYQIIQDGYVVLSTDGGVPILGEDELGNGQEGLQCKKISELTIINDEPLLDKKVVRPQEIIEGASALTWKNESGKEFESNEKLANMSTVTIDGNSYYLRFMPLTSINAISPSDNYYSQIAVTLNGVSQYFYLNPHYAKSEIKNNGNIKDQEQLAPTPPTLSYEFDSGNEAKNNAVEIRTERQYSMMTQDLQIYDSQSDADRKRYGIYQNLFFSQECSLDFGEESSSYTRNYFDIATSTVIENGGVAITKPVSISGTVNVRTANTGNADANEVFVDGPGTGFKGVYDGNGKVINNLSITAEDGKSAGMFGNTQGALIQNLTLANITVAAENSNCVGGLIGSAAAFIDSGESGSRKKYTRIQNINIENAKITGAQCVGGLVGVAYSCSVDTVAINGTEDLGNIITGDTMIGGAFGLIQARTGKSASDVIACEYKNISVSGSTSVEETSDHSNVYYFAGIGGFAGEIYIKNADALKSFTFSDINIGASNSEAVKISIADGEKNSRMYGGLFVGSLNGQTNRDGLNLNNAFNNCDIVNTNMKIEGASDDERLYSCFGGLFGSINQRYRQPVEITINKNIEIHENCEIKYVGKADQSERCAIGGLIGNLSKGNVILDGDSWTIPRFSGFTPNNAEALGGYIGCVREDATLSANQELVVSIPEKSTAKNVGGLVGQIGLQGGKADGGNVNVDIKEIWGSSEAVTDSQVCNIGGVIGAVCQGATVNDLSVKGVSFNSSGGENVSVGGCIGKVEKNTTITANVVGVELRGTAKNLGGFVGQVNGGNVSASLENVKISSAEATVNAGGFVGSLAEGTITSSSVNNMNLTAEATYAGGFVGNLEKGTIASGTVDTITFKGTAKSAGGFAGNVSQGAITDSSVNDINLTADASYVGGFAGRVAGANPTITNCDVRSTTLQKSKFKTNENGEYIDSNNKVVPFGVTGSRSEGMVGGFAGESMTATITKCFAAIPVKGTGSYISLGGFLGCMSGGAIDTSYASCNVLNKDYIVTGSDQYSQTGGFVGFVQGANEITDCYATGDVKRGVIVGGFVGEAKSGSANYLNNLYSLGEVDQQKGAGGEFLKHGGFMGWNQGELRRAPLDLNRVQVRDFYNMLRIDLSDHDAIKKEFPDIQGEDLKTIDICFEALAKRVLGKSNPNKTEIENTKKILKKDGRTSIEKYLLDTTNVDYNIDSTANNKGKDSSITADKPSVSSIVAELLGINYFNSLQGVIKTWRLTKDTKLGKIFFYYSAADIETMYTTDDIDNAKNNGTKYTIVGYKYESIDNERSMQTKGIFDLTTNNTTTSYGSYVVLGRFEATGKPEEVPDELTVSYFTGCTYLRENVRGYNATNTWEDSSTAYEKNVKYRNFEEFMDSNGEYLKELNDNSEETERFKIPAVDSFPYDFELTEDKGGYPYPSLNEKVGKDSDASIHWGDWPLVPKKISKDVGLVYYEKVEKGLYYHGYIADYNEGTTTYEEVSTVSDAFSLENGLIKDKGKHAKEGGYLVLLPHGTDVKSISIKMGDTELKQGNGLILLKVEDKHDIGADSTLSAYDLYFLVVDSEGDKVYGNGESEFQIGSQDESKEGSFKYSAEFIMTPHFADSIRLKTDENEFPNTYYVRTAKQLRDLSNSQRLAGMAEDDKNTFVQTLDIDYAKGEVSHQGVTIENYRYDMSIPKMNADYIVRQITEKSGNRVGYTINGISVAMFELIGKNSEISGITLTDPVITGKGAVGFAKTNEGKINSCSVRPSGKEYSQVQVKCVGMATAGFVWTNAGVIQDSSFIGNVGLEWTQEDTWGNISGFVDINTGTIDACYSNVILSFYAGWKANKDCAISGFCQSNREGGEIRNSHAISEMYFYRNNKIYEYGSGYGFAKSNYLKGSAKGLITNSYAATKKMGVEQDHKYEFAGFKDGVKNNYYLRLDENTGFNWGAEPKTYTEMLGLVNEGEAATVETTHRYDESLPEVYPFALPATDKPYLTMQHYGDWPDIDFDVGLVYYELMQNGDGSKDDKVYYHGWQGAYVENWKGYNYKEIKTPGDGLVDGLVTGADKYVREDGYLVILPEGADLNDLKIEMKGIGENAEIVLEKSGLKLEGIPSNYNVYYLKTSYDINKVNFGNGPGVVSVTGRSGSTHFTMTPLFGDSIMTGQHKDEMKSFKIRSARQLVQLAASGNESYSKNTENSFTQSLDIDFKNVEFTEKNQSVEYAYNKPIAGMQADYSVDTWKDEYGNICGYIINGIETSMFDAIGTNGTIKGVTLTDVQNADSGYPYGFASSNSGTIESCSIRARDIESKTAYTDVLISVSDKDIAAGFIGTNKASGRIDNCYITGSIQVNRNNNSNKVDAAGFVYNNSGKITNSYANCRTTIAHDSQNNGKDTGSGFCYDNLDGGVIENSHSVGSILFKNTQNAGKSYGFVAINGKSNITNCYSAMDVLSSSENYVFSGTSTGAFFGCYYLNNQPKNSIVQGDAVSKTYAEMERIASDESTKATAETTKRYDKSLPEVYPFALPHTDTTYLTIQHYGDWPEEVTEIGDVAILYYEKINDKVYYHGYNIDGIELKSRNGNVKGLIDAPGNYVTESGYVLLVKGEVSKGNDTISFNGDKGKQYEKALTKKHEDKEGYVVYNLLTYEGVKDDRANIVAINYKVGSNERVAKFSMTPYFADSVSIVDNSSTESTDTTFYIRDEQHLSNLVGYSKFAENGTYTFIQQLDLDFSSETGNTPQIATLNAQYQSDTYSDEDGNVLGYTIKGIKQVLFKTIAGTGSVTNLSIVDSTILSNAGFVYENRGTIESCRVYGTTGYQAMSIGDETNGDAAGFVMNNYGAISNSFIAGAVHAKGKAVGFVLHNKVNGQIISSYANCILDSKEKFAFGFAEDSMGSIENCHALIMDAKFVGGKDGGVYGFIKNGDSAGVINCYAAMSQIPADVKTPVYGFGNVSSDGNYYLKGNNNFNENNATVSALSYEEMFNRVTNGCKATSLTTKTYSIAGTYPFALPFTQPEGDTAVLTMQHYGDWPELPEAEEVVESYDEVIESPDVEIQETELPAFTAGIAYYENDGQDYEGWYAFTVSSTSVDTPMIYDTLRRDSDYKLPDDAVTSYGILIATGTVPECSGAVIEENPIAQVNINGFDYDYYPIVADENLVDIGTVTVTNPQGAETFTFSYNQNLAGAIAFGETLETE